jgi:transcriptional regulator with XRE-family HTH domain
MTFGHYLRATRRGQRLPMSQLAAETGISPAGLLDLECNRRGPSYEELQRLAAALHRPQEELLREAGVIGGKRARVV